MFNPNIDALFRRRYGRRHVMALAGSAGAAAVLASCSGKSTSSGDATATRGEEQGTTADGTVVTRPAGWSVESHSNQVDPGFAKVFPADRINTMRISVPAETWSAMLANMVTIAGARGSGGAGGAGVVANPGGGRQQFPGGQVPADGQPPVAGGTAPGQGQQFPGGGGGMAAGGLANPDWFKATIEFDGKTWTNVGLRFKGNSTLRSAWNSGTDAMPFKLDFDEWEGEHPEINNQRFYGFKQLSLSNNTGDASYAREMLAYDFFKGAGLPAANTALWNVELDRGEGARSLGLYTFIEVIDDTVVERIYGDDSGNVYEGDGQAASFAAGTKSAIQASFQAEGGDDPDWSDVNALYDAIHATTRTSDHAKWKRDLEAVFDIDGFLEWLGIAAVISHWDTYGQMTHNYYLYNEKNEGKLTYISWDHNFVMGASMGGGGGQAPGGLAAQGGAQPVSVGGNVGGRGGMGNVSLDKNDVTEQWPLIRWLIDDPDYKSAYVRHMREFMQTQFTTAKLNPKLDALQKMVAASASNEIASANGTAITSLKSWIATRIETVNAFLASA